ncbi:MAG TPA: hypothetical protein VIQ30_24355 [Pseudonocardia sp.]
MSEVENITDLWVNNPDRAAQIRAVWRDLGKALDELMPEDEGELVELTGDALPYHLQLDAPARAKCSQCGRSTWITPPPGQLCLMPQPNGSPCPGVFSMTPPAAQRHPDRELAEDGMPYWVSWWCQTAFEYHGPWWISGEGPLGSSVVAAVHAVSEREAMRVIEDAHDNGGAEIEWRFVDEREPDWSPFASDRFPRAEWMRWPV